MSRKAYISTNAILSRDREYRYALFRRWDDGPRQLVVIGLNPSTADEERDDQTIRRCVAFAKREGCSALVMLNLFALRATNPREMLAHPEPIGPENDQTIDTYATGDDLIVVAAWGVDGKHRGRAEQVSRRLPHLMCFGFTKNGHPRHPLYVHGSAPLVPYRRPDPASRTR